MFSILLISVLFSFTLHAMEGLQYLNAFPSTEAFTRFGFGHTSSDFEVDERTSDVGTKVLHGLTVSATYGKKLTANSFATIELPFTYKEDFAPHFATGEEDITISRGIREPELSWFYRLKHEQTDGDYFSDLKLSLIPGLMNKSIKDQNSSAWSGTSVLKARLSTGALYQKYEARVRSEYTYYSWYQGTNKDRDENFSNAQYYSMDVFLDLQYMKTEKIFLFLSSGIMFSSDFDVKTSQSSTTIQQGSASIGEVGAKYLLKEGYIELRYTYQRNDYFVSNKREGNFRGDLTQEDFSLSWTKNL